MAAVATNMLPALSEEAKKRQVANLRQGDEIPVASKLKQAGITGRAAGQAAALTGAGNTNVYQAKRVKKAAPELFKRVEAGEISVVQRWDNGQVIIRRRISHCDMECWPSLARTLIPEPIPTRRISRCNISTS